MISIAFYRLFCRITGTGTGSTCSSAKELARSNRNNEAISNYTKYCNCNAGSWNYYTSIDLTCISHESLVTAASVKVTYNNPCGSSKSGTVGITNGHSSVASRSITIPTGSGTKTESFTWIGGQKCGELTATGSGSGTC